MATAVAWTWWHSDEAQKYHNPPAYLDRQIQRLEDQIPQQWFVRSLERELAKKPITRQIDVEEEMDLLAGSGMTGNEVRKLAEESVDLDIREAEQRLAEARSQLEQYREQLREAKQQRLELARSRGR